MQLGRLDQRLLGDDDEALAALRLELARPRGGANNPDGLGGKSGKKADIDKVDNININARPRVGLTDSAVIFSPLFSPRPRLADLVASVEPAGSHGGARLGAGRPAKDAADLIQSVEPAQVHGGVGHGEVNQVANCALNKPKRKPGKSNADPERVIARLKRDKADPEHPDREKAGFFLAGIERGEIKPTRWPRPTFPAGRSSPQGCDPKSDYSKPMHPGRRYKVTLRPRSALVKYLTTVYADPMSEIDTPYKRQARWRQRREAAGFKQQICWIPARDGERLRKYAKRLCTEFEKEQKSTNGGNSGRES